MLHKILGYMFCCYCVFCFCFSVLFLYMLLFFLYFSVLFTIVMFILCNLFMGGDFCIPSIYFHTHFLAF